MSMRIVAALVVAVLGLVACDGDDGASVRDLGGSASSGSGSGSGSGTGVASGSGTEPAEECASPDLADPSLPVRLSEYQILPEEDELTRGPTRFRVMNVGEEEHEFIVLAARSVEALPLDDKGSVDEESLPEDMLVAEIESIPAGDACALEVDLDPGTYVLLCNLRERGGKGVVNHFLQGMRTRIKVS